MTAPLRRLELTRTHRRPSTIGPAHHSVQPGQAWMCHNRRRRMARAHPRLRRCLLPPYIDRTHLQHWRRVEMSRSIMLPVVQRVRQSPRAVRPVRRSTRTTHQEVIRLATIPAHIIWLLLLRLPRQGPSPFNGLHSSQSPSSRPSTALYLARPIILWDRVSAVIGSNGIDQHPRLDPLDTRHPIL